MDQKIMQENKIGLMFLVRMTEVSYVLFSSEIREAVHECCMLEGPQKKIQTSVVNICFAKHDKIIVVSYRNIVEKKK